MIRKVIKSDENDLLKFFQLMVRNTYIKEGVGHLESDIVAEINSKHEQINLSIKDELNMYVYTLNNQIIGTAAWLPCSELISEHAPSLASLMELGSVFIHKDYQNQGHGQMLVNHMMSILKERGLKAFCLDSGYGHAVKVWHHKFGEPFKCLEDYWDKDVNHYIWKVALT